LKDLKNLPSMPFLVDRYVNDTSHLTLEEHGAYLLLLCNMWRRAGSIDDDDKGNARMLGVQPKEWLRLKQVLMPLLVFGGGKISQKRLQIQWNYAQENRLRQSEKGKAGAKARIERNQALESIRGLGRGTSTSNGTGQAETSTEIKHPYKKEIPIPLSTTVGLEEGSEQEPTAGIPARLNTPLLRRHA